MDHVGPEEFDKLNLLNTEYRAHQLSLNLVHKVFYNNSPIYLNENFTKLNNSSRYNTRSKQFNFFVPSIKGATSKTFYYNGIKLWNSLPRDLKETENNNCFKKHLKNYLSAEMSRHEAETFFYY